MKTTHLISILIFLIVLLLNFSILYIIYYPTKTMVYNKVNRDCINSVVTSSLTTRQAEIAEVESCSNIALKISGINYEPSKP